MNERYSVLTVFFERFIIFLGLLLIVFPFTFYAVVQDWLPWFHIFTVINFSQLFWGLVYAVIINMVIVIVYHKLTNR